MRTVHLDAAQKHPRSYLGSLRCCRHIFPGIAFVTRFTGHLRYEGNKQNRSKRECAARLQTSEINWKVTSQPGQWRLHVFFSPSMPKPHTAGEGGKGQADEDTHLSATAPDIASITNL